MDGVKVSTPARISGALLLALMINLLLFAMMQQMVAGRHVELSDIADAQIIDFIRVPDHLESAPQRRLRKKAPDPPEPPEQPPKQILPQLEALKQPLPKPLPRLKIDAPQATIDSDGPYLGGMALKAPGFIMAHDLIAVLRRPPSYPRLLKRRGIEGYVLVEFTVTEQGLVQDPVIIESHPHEDFGKSVIRTVRYWKFKPYRLDDKPIAVRARQGIDFTME
jgi:protein TonB